MERAAVDADGLLIPLIDFSKFTGGDEDQKRQTASAILRGFQTAGFVYLVNFGIGREVRDRVFARSAEFFGLPAAAKDALGWTTPQANRGYSAPGREKVSQLTDLADVDKVRLAAPDIKESFEIGREGEPGHPNQWPSEGDDESVVSPGFRDAMLDFCGRCRALHVEVMRAIATGMDLDSGFFDGFVDAGDNTLRLLHYPAVARDVFRANPDQVRAGEHSDYGSVTLLFQDARGGLQVRSPAGRFVDAEPVDGACVVNAGDLLARWSNDTIKSTIHRVVEPPSGTKEESYPPRYSIAYFCNPNFDSYIEALPGTYVSAGEKKYEGIESGRYLVQRLTATY